MNEYKIQNNSTIITPMKENLPALVIDDEPQISSFIAQLLTGAGGWTVAQANCAEQSFERLAEQPCVLVFCDEMLDKGEDGYAVMRRFAEAHPAGRFVLTTG